jgi:two-component system, OmpR family, phosphate regulon sensor histidine kinase PhoR
MDYVVLIIGAFLAAAGLTALVAARRPGPPRQEATPAQIEAPPPANESSRRMDALLEALPAGVIIVSPDGRIAAVNASAASMFGIAPERAIGRTLIESVRSYELDRRITAALADGVEESSELTFIAATERRLHVATRATTRDDGKREAIVVAVDRTRMIELETMRRDFVSNVSHELRSPLTAIKIMTETLQDGADPAAAREFLENIARETDRMIALVEDLLDLARLESGRLDLRFDSVDLSELVRDAVSSQSIRASKLGIRLEAVTPGSGTAIAGDRDMLTQVVVNLLDNALRNTPSGGTVTARVSSNGTGVAVDVEDTGIGIASDALPHVFERFYVVDRSRAKSKGGTGLGLAIVKHIVEAHGGSVEAQSELGRGSSFRCSFGAAAKR